MYFVEKFQTGKKLLKKKNDDVHAHDEASDLLILIHLYIKA